MTCQSARLYESPPVRDIHQRETLRDAREAEAPTYFLEKHSVDHIITRSDVGHGGETCTLVIVDQFSGMTGLAPGRTKSAGEVEDALRRFCGKHRPRSLQPHTKGFITLLPNQPFVPSRVQQLHFCDIQALVLNFGLLLKSIRNGPLTYRPQLGTLRMRKRKRKRLGLRKL